MKKNITYEYPLNERIRSFLRLEHLFGIVNHHSTRDSQWDSRITISCLFDILNLISRCDIKNQLIKYLERYSVILDKLKINSNIDHKKLDNILKNINRCLTALRDSNSQYGQQLEQDDLAISIRQKLSMLGGACSFDLPAFHHWLNKPIQCRREDMEIWQKDITVIQDSLEIVLFMLRNSTTPVTTNAVSGFYQQSINPQLPCQLIRVVFTHDSKYFPEISGSKHRFTAIFMEKSSTSSKPVQTKNDVEFELHCCIL